MNIYRCSFVLTEYNNLETVLFLRTLDEETASSKSEEIFKENLVKYKIPNAKFIKTVTLSSEEETENYKLYMSQRNKNKKDLN